MIKRILAAFAVLAAALFGIQAPANAASGYYYVAGIQNVSGATEPYALAARISVANPTVDGTGPDWENHTVTAIAMNQGSGGTFQSVELGVRKTPADANMKLFAYTFVNGSPCGYALTNMCGSGINFVHCDMACGNTTDNWDIGTAVASGTNLQLNVQFTSTAVWFEAYTVGGTREWLGYILDDLWDNAGVTFETADEIKAYGEVAPGGGNLGCTDMGNGVAPAAGPPITGAFFGSVTAPPLANSSIDIDSATVITDASKYSMYVPTPGANIRTFWYGGPGAC